jgi:hypothetical protein
MTNDVPARVIKAVAPAELPPPHGSRPLVRWQRSWRPYRQIRKGAAISSRRAIG